MVREIFGKKIGMTQIFDGEGNVLPVTVVEVEPVSLLETVEYPHTTKVKIGCFKISDAKKIRLKKPVRGYFEKMGAGFYALIREVDPEPEADFSFLCRKKQQVDKAGEQPQGDSRQEHAEETGDKEAQDTPKEPAEETHADKPEEGAKKEEQERKESPVPSREVGVEIFSEGDSVDIQSKTKGKGFAGGMKRWGWSGQPKSHGSTMHRRLGSAGASAYPAKIIKGIHMPGRMGGWLRTVKNLKVLKVDEKKQLLFIKGNIPGSRNAIVKITRLS